MASANHIIRRQVFEIKTASTATDGTPDPHLQARAREWFERYFLPVVDRCCSEVAPPGTRLQIERLEIDLGPLDFSKPDENRLQTTAQKLATELRRVLREKTSTRQPASERVTRSHPLTNSASERPPRPDWSSDSAVFENAPDHAAFDLLEHFLKTGQLPWWADANNRAAVREAFLQFLKTENQALTSRFRFFFKNPAARLRLLRHLENTDLLALCRRLEGPDFEATVGQWLEKLISSGHFSSAEREVFGAAVLVQLGEAGDLGLPALAAFDLLEHFLKTGKLLKQPKTGNRAAVRAAFLEFLKIENQAIANRFRFFLKNPAARLRLLRHLENADLLALCQRLEGPDFEATIGQWLEKLVSSGHFSTAERVVFWEAVLAQVSAADDSSLPDARFQKRADADSPAARFQKNAGSGLPAARFQKLDNIFFEIKKRLPEILTERVTRIFSLETQAAELNETPSKLRNLETSAPASGPDLPPGETFSESERLYVENAGLVLLGPYLPLFFENLGLLEDKKFASSEAAWVAVQLLQYLADGVGEEAPPEFLLALPKILCGLAPGAVFAPQRLLKEAEKAEAEALLEAVLENAPGLGLKSVGGLRGSFLLRSGVLRPGTGHWVLHVEGEMFDLVLKKLPWSFQTLRLPWMEGAVVVDWGLPGF